MQLIDFPLEILEQVIAASIPIHPCPSSVLCVSRVFYRLGMRTLHLNLRFVSSVQIALFGTSDHSPACAPRSIEVTLGGANSDFYIFDRLHTVFLRCRTVLDDTTNQKKPLERSVPVHLDSLSLCFHSHAKNTRLHCIRTAFALVKYSVFSTRRYHELTSSQSYLLLLDRPRPGTPLFHCGKSPILVANISFPLVMLCVVLIHNSTLSNYHHQ
jgi:hypothetical protein